MLVQNFLPPKPYRTNTKDGTNCSQYNMKYQENRIINFYMFRSPKRGVTDKNGTARINSEKRTANTAAVIIIF